MNRMIKLFQQKSDQFYEKYLVNRETIVTSHGVDLNSPEWQAAVTRGADLKARFETWAKAAELLRKEELQK
jgi:hypothetical protein